MVSMPKIDSPTRQLIPFAPTVLRPSQLRTTSFLVALRYEYLSDSKPTKAASASSSLLVPSTTNMQTAWTIVD